MKIIIATTSRSKVNDIKNIISFSKLSYKVDDILSLDELGISLPSSPEDCDTVKGNSEQKLAFYYEKLVGTKYSSPNTYLVSEDTGLFINALNGEPGVRTARYGGVHDYELTNRMILDKMNNKINRYCTINSCISSLELVPGKTLNDIKSYDVSFHCCKIAGSESRVKGFAFDTIVIPFTMESTTYSELSATDRLKYLPRKYAIEEFLYDNIDNLNIEMRD